MVTKIRLATVPAFFALLSGCASPTASQAPASMPSSYTLSVSADLAPEQQASILAAANDWAAATGVRFVVSIEQCVPFALPQNICVHPGSLPANGEDGWTQWDPASGSADVWLDVSRIAVQQWQQVASHELGHAMGLIHHDGDVVMNPVLEHESTTITPDDVAQWRALRGSAD